MLRDCCTTIFVLLVTSCPTVPAQDSQDTVPQSQLAPTGTEAPKTPQKQTEAGRLKKNGRFRKKNSPSGCWARSPTSPPLTGALHPLTPGQKFHLFFKSAFDPVECGVVGGAQARKPARVILGDETSPLPQTV